MNSKYETPDALKHDSQTLAADARNLLDATANVADEKVSEARKRLTVALASAKECAVESLHKAQEKARDGAREADRVIRSHPYEAIGVALGIGTVLGLLLARRD